MSISDLAHQINETEDSPSDVMVEAQRYIDDGSWDTVIILAHQRGGAGHIIYSKADPIILAGLMTWAAKFLEADYTGDSEIEDV